MILRPFAFLLAFATLLPLALSFSFTPTGGISFCKCICFSNSTILPLYLPKDPLKPCLTCTRQFCLDQKLPSCIGATTVDEDLDTGTGTEGDVEARCFQRDSPKSHVLVVLFIVVVCGLLGGAVLKQYAGVDFQQTYNREGARGIASEVAELTRILIQLIKRSRNGRMPSLPLPTKKSIKLSSLLSIILVARSSRGASLVYSYPPEPTSVPRTSKPIYPSLRHDNAPDSGYTSDTSSDSSDELEDDSSDDDEIHLNAPENEDPDRLNGHSDEAKALEQYLGFSKPVLAALLCPSRELCDQPFELVVDHLAFVGHPVWMGDEEAEIARTGEAEDEDEEDRRGRSRRPREDDDDSGFSRLGGDSNGGGGGSTNMARDRTVLGLSSGSTSRTSSAPAPLSRHGSPATGASVVRSPSSGTTMHPHSSTTASSQQSHTSIHGSGRITSFNFVCVIDTPPDSHLSSHLEGYYKDVVIPMTANMKALERKGKWLGKESAKLRKAKESYMSKGLSPADHVAKLPELSSLAAAMSQLYNSLKADMLANITLGNFPVQVLLRGELPFEDSGGNFFSQDEFVPHPSSKPLEATYVEDSASDGGRSLSPVERYQPQRPPLFSRMRTRPPVKFQAWETLLLLEDVEDLKRDVLENSFLWRFLEICDPVLSFAEYEILLDVGDEEEGSIQEIVEHLVHWKKARVIDVVSLRSSYAITPNYQPSALLDLYASFHTAFPRLPPLPVLLAQLSPTEPFQSIVPISSLRQMYTNALVWLLRRSVVEKQRAYVRIVISEDIKRAASMQWAASSSRGKDSFTDSASGASDRPRTSSSVGSSGAGSSTGAGSSGFARQRTLSSRPDLEDTKSMAIVGSALSASPPLAKSYQSNRSARVRTLVGKARTTSSMTYSSNSEKLDDGGSKGPSVVLEPGRPSVIESRWISEICREKEKGVVEKFDRMVRMLNGAHHLDEIRFRASLSRKDIKLVLAAFQEHLIIFTHS